MGMVMPLSLCVLVLDKGLDLLDQFDLFARQFPLEHSAWLPGCKTIPPHLPGAQQCRYDAAKNMTAVSTRILA
jgi:hypothetical protein